ncbi:MAG TPA: DNA-binding response regulator [candidate division Zixibacteria bacterium]|nr:DNA-binding response regulator [candidate division Zixibacteria bacterium]
MAINNILVIEDDQDILELIRYNLQKEHYQVTSACNGEEALKIIKKDPPHLILLDLMLPGIDGLEICRILKAESSLAMIPIIMVTARGEETDIVLGLELGAEDYIVKPFSPRVLIARIRTVLRRKGKTATDTSQPIRINELTIHPGKREVLLSNKPLDLTFTEFELLYHLASRPGWVFTRYQIVNAVKGDDYPVTDRSVDVQIAGLRKKLGDYGDLIETIRGIGYRFSDKEIEDKS